MIGDIISAGASLIGGKLDSDAAEDRASQDWQNTKTLNKNAIQWKVNDAKSAGLHPLYALGSSAATSYASAPTGNHMGNAIGNAGAAIGRGLDRNREVKRDVISDAQTANMHQHALLESKARTAKDLAEAGLYNSQMKRAEHSANIRQDGPAKQLFDGGMDNSKNPIVLGVPFGKPGQVPAQTAGDWFSEPGEWGAGLLNIVDWLARANFAGTNTFRKKQNKKHRVYKKKRGSHYPKPKSSYGLSP